MNFTLALRCLSIYPAITLDLVIHQGVHVCMFFSHGIFIVASDPLDLFCAPMEILRRLLGRKVYDGPQNQCTSSDEVFPVHPLDQAGIVRSSVISYTFRYDDVLDADKLRSSLVSLLEIEGWRKFGGRLRLDVSCQPQTVLQRLIHSIRLTISWKFTFHYDTPLRDPPFDFLTNISMFQSNNIR